MSSSAPVMRRRTWRECNRGGTSGTESIQHSALTASLALRWFHTYGFLPGFAQLNAECLLLQNFHLAADSGILPHQNHEVGSVNCPGRDVGSDEVTHRETSSSDCSDCACSTSRCTTSRR